MTTVCHARLYGTFIEIKKQLRERETSYYELKFYFFGGSLSNRDNVRALIQFRRDPVSESSKIIFPQKIHAFSHQQHPSYLVINPLTTNVPHHIETSQLICNVNQWTGFYKMGNTGR